MDILSPCLIWVDGKCYRVPQIISSNLEPEKKEYNEPDFPFDYDEKNCEEEMDEDCDIADLIETLPNNKFKLNLSIPQTFWSKIIGIKGATKKRIENNTNTIIMVPKPMEHGDVIIKGSSKRSILLAKKNIDAVISSSRQKMVFTHFISIPMNTEDIKKNFICFKDQVLQLCGKDRGVDESIFQHPDKLHLTIGTLVLTDQNERNLGEKLLNEVFENEIKPIIACQKNIILEMMGIEYMNDDPSEVDVLYGKIFSKGNTDLIQKIADLILKHFSHHNLIKCDDKEKVKLHVTLMNTLFREEDPDELDVETENFNRNKWNKKPRRTFNAVNILQNFHNFYFGQQELKSIQLSVRFSTAKDGYYKSSCVINF